MASDQLWGRDIYERSYSGSNFRFYLAGLIEGDGTIIVPQTERSAKVD